VSSRAATAPDSPRWPKPGGPDDRAEESDADPDGDLDDDDDDVGVDVDDDVYDGPDLFVLQASSILVGYDPRPRAEAAVMVTWSDRMTPSPPPCGQRDTPLPGSASLGTPRSLVLEAFG
jgi:hypothetical protein